MLSPSTTSLRSPVNRLIALLSFLARVSSSYFLIRIVPTVSATFSIARCCTLAARENFREYYEELYPWQLSSLEQWLVPLSTYISPYIGILLLCPVGDAKGFGTGEGHHSAITKKVLGGLNIVWKPVQEHFSLLGDPASAVFGALHEIWSDARSLRGLKSYDPDSPAQQRSWIAILSGNLKCPDSSGASSSHAPLLVASPDNKQVSDLTTEPLTAPERVSAADRAIETVLAARGSFVSTILLPVILMFAVTAATFYDAYSKKGDKNTGLSLAYCVWYSWIIVLGVASNSSISIFSSEAAHRAFDGVIDLGKLESTSLRHRFINAHLWKSWSEATENAGWTANATRHELRADWRLWLRFCIGQLIGLSCVAFSSAGATVIAWTTPTTGLGCRSFNFILYVILSAAASLLRVLYTWMSLDPHAKTNFRYRLPALGFLYWLFVVVNSQVMILGTVFHLVGVFRTCWCDRLFWNESTQIELNSKTTEAVENADTYWLSTAYVVFGGVWLACFCCMVLRGFIVRKLQNFIDCKRAVAKEACRAVRQS
ncbi:unnamed protein product [Parascedosporium putredinis]|uniref:Uncharacterized protein n=1 Tax=Parascedosporium putredinis TaxID=1442378 RepID=A0A9P1H1A2_9PEZI|nr:unnamed protein product [Parascedosporium putredinis]CAI7992534.1 unnamed protein product [Parascedosporium putredinis]